MNIETEEVWRSLKGGDHSVSNLGKVRREPYIDARGRSRAAKILQPVFRRHLKDSDKAKVGVVRIVGGRAATWVPVPRLVAQAFLPEYHFSRHTLRFRDLDHSNWISSNIEASPRVGATKERGDDAHAK